MEKTKLDGLRNLQHMKAPFAVLFPLKHSCFFKNNFHSLTVFAPKWNEEKNEQASLDNMLRLFLCFNLCLFPMLMLHLSVQ